MAQASPEPADPLRGLDPDQRAAVEAGSEQPLLIIAGAGSGKTRTLVHRVAHLIRSGADPRRVLLLTFTRRAAAEMIRRVQRLCEGKARRGAGARAVSVRWAGTFHAISHRLLRRHAEAIGLAPSFTVLDRSDAADLLDLARHRLGLARKARRFPRKATCVAIYSRVVNTGAPLGEVLDQAFPWCREWEDELRALFGAYVEDKQARSVLDYDDLLLYWRELMGVPELCAQVREGFDHVLVDEYQDTNALQEDILLALCPDGRGLTVVGDDAQSIYSFRAATVENILRFPDRFHSPAQVVKLERNYRSTQPILDAANAIMAEARRRYEKTLVSHKGAGESPRLVTTLDEATQVDYVIEQILLSREDGVPLKQQAVLFRTAHHSDALEVELGRRNIPFVKYGGLKFLEAAHIKDVLSVLRWAENPRDLPAAFRTLQLLPGVGPAAAHRALAFLDANGNDLSLLRKFPPPAAAREHWPPLCSLLEALHDASAAWDGQLGRVRKWYEPYLEEKFDAPAVRDGDLEQLELIAGQYRSRARFLADLTLDPPEGTGDEAGPPHLDEDYLILSTIHSAKGQEWDVVYVLNASDGCIPSDMATGSPEQIEEERRLLYVAVTRAKRALHVVHPQRYFVRHQAAYGDRHIYAPRSRFLSDGVVERFELVGHGAAEADDGRAQATVHVNVGARLRRMWD